MYELSGICLTFPHKSDRERARRKVIYLYNGVQSPTPTSVENRSLDKMLSASTEAAAEVALVVVVILVPLPSDVLVVVVVVLMVVDGAVGAADPPWSGVGE